MRLLPIALALVTAVACTKDGPVGIEPAGPPAALAIVGSGGTVTLTGRAGAALATPVSVQVHDARGRGVPGQTVTFAVTAGGGSLASTTAVTDGSGVAVLPTWTFGKTNVPQKVQATLGSFSAEISATVQTQFQIDVRFYGAAVSPTHQALFTGAAERLTAIIIGDIVNVDASASVDLAARCGLSGLPTISEIIDDVVIYAAVQEIDGPGKVLAQAGPCLIRQGFGSLPAVGVMSFDVADVELLVSGGRLQDVITHEMLHVLGIGTLWQRRNLIVDTQTDSVRYTGAEGRAGCVQVGGNVECSTTVPVENTGGAGTRDGHWRESVFDSELMTGFAERGEMPLSFLTIGGLADLGYTVNRDARDQYNIPMPVNALAARIAADPPVKWESGLPVGPSTITPSGQIGPRLWP